MEWEEVLIQLLLIQQMEANQSDGLTVISDIGLVCVDCRSHWRLTKESDFEAYTEHLAECYKRRG